MSSSAITAICNYYACNSVFSKEIQVKANPTSLIIAFTTSSNSGNIIKIFEAVEQKK